MNNRLFNLLLFTVLIGGLISCKSKNSKPCDYIEYEYAEVTILDILVEEGKEEVKIEVSVDKGALAGEIQYLGNLKKTTFTKASVDKNKIKIGNRYSVQISEPKDKDCGETIIGWRTKITD